MTHFARGLAAISAAIVLAGVAHAQLAGVTVEKLTIATQPAKDGAKLTVTSTSFKPGASIPLANSAFGDNKSPQLSWSKGPEGTVSYLIVMEDPDVGPRQPYLHWIIGDLTATTTRLPEGLTATPEGAFQTSASIATNKTQYFGPRPPSGLHNYTFQVFALDTSLRLYDGSKLSDVQEAMSGHVLASGALQGTYAAPAK